MEDCIFCRILEGRIPCSRVLENEHVLAFLDIAPVVKGHTLVIPREHVVNILDMPPHLAGQVYIAVQQVGNALMKGLGAEGFNLGMNNFKAAGQLVMHAHFHLIPRFSGDGLKLWPQHSYENDQEMNQVLERIRSGFKN
ncbi:MAG: HIT family protein [Desulfonatronovibrionaceae bacterium]